MKFSIGVAESSEFSENCSDSHAIHTGIYKLLPIHATFLTYRNFSLEHIISHMSVEEILLQETLSFLQTEFGQFQFILRLYLIL